MKKNVISLCSFVLLPIYFCLLLLFGQAAASTIDLYQNFPDSQGENGFYAYAYAVNTGVYTPLTDAGEYNFYRPEEPTWGNPHVYKYSDPWIFLSCSGTRSNPGSPEDGILAYVVPETAYYELSGTFYDIPGSLNGIEVYIKKNSVTLWSTYLGSGGAQEFDIAQTIFNAGDIIYFGVDAINNTYFSEYNDWGLLKGQMNVEAVPVPGTMLLIVTGILGLVGFKLKWKEK